MQFAHYLRRAGICEPVAGERSRAIFQMAAGLTAVFSKRFVFELIEDEEACIMSSRSPLQLGFVQTWRRRR